MSAYETEAILLAWHVSDGPQGHWVKFKLPLAITDGHPFALFAKGPEHGQRFRMTFEAIGSDELPTGHEIVGSAPSPSIADAADSPAAAPKPKKHWDELKPSQQAGMACRDASFREWTQDVMASPEHRWDGAEYCDSFMSEEGTKDWPACYVRWYCGVSSRSDLDTHPEAAKRWRELFGMFQADTQYGDRR